MCDAYGIVNFDSENVHVKGMGEYRPVSAFSYLGRYRLVDFPLSNMSNSGIDQIKVLVKSNPRSLVEHLGNGRQYNLNSKRGRLQIIPAISSEGVDVNNTDICAMRSILELLEAMPQEYVIIAPQGSGSAAAAASGQRGGYLGIVSECGQCEERVSQL